MYRYISKNLNIMKKVNIYYHSFQKVKPINYIDSLHIEWNISNLCFLKCWWLWLTDNETPKFSVLEHLKYIYIYIRLHKINKKGYFKQKYQASEKVCSFLCTPFAWITASMRRGMASISLWHCSGVMKPRLLWQCPSGHLHCWVWCLSSSSWQYIDSLRGSGQASLLANQAE